MLLLLLRGHGAGTPVGSLPTVDTFTAADGTDLDGREPDQGDGVWDVLSGAADIQSNRLRAGVGGTDTIAVIDTGQTNHVTAIDLVSGTVTDTWLLVRYRIVSGGTDTYFAVRNNGGTLQLFEQAGAGLTLRDSDTGAGTYPSTVTVTCSGSAITCACGSASFTYSAGAPHAEATYVGILAEQEATFDNLNAEESADRDTRYPTGRYSKTQNGTGRASRALAVSGKAGKSVGVTGRMPN
jgi:hypothetical protein